MTNAVVEGGIIRTAAHKYRENAPTTYGRSAGAGMTAMQAINLAMGITDKKEEEDDKNENEKEDEQDNSKENETGAQDSSRQGSETSASATFAREPHHQSG